MIPSIKRSGLFISAALSVLGLLYMSLLAAMFISGTGMPPVEPYNTSFNVLVLLTAPGLVMLWAVVHAALPAEKQLFSRAALALVSCAAALTCINRYVALTVVRQSLAAGQTAGLEWFMPYGWPSVMLAIEILAWGFFFGLACLCLAPAFTGNRLAGAIRWTLLVTGGLSLCAALGQVVNSLALSLAGPAAWGPGLTAAAVLSAIWFNRRELG